MKNTLLTIGCCFILLLLISGCTKPERKPQFKFYNYSPDAPSLSMDIQGGYSESKGATYKGAPLKGEVAFEFTGMQKITIKSLASQQKYYEGDVQLQEYGNYSIFACNSILQMQQLTVSNNNSLPEAGKCHVRFVNLLPNAGSVRLTLGGQKFFDNIPYLTASDYVLVNPDTLLAEARKTDGTFLTTDHGKIYEDSTRVTLVLSGFLGGATATYTPTITAQREYP